MRARASRTGASPRRRAIGHGSDGVLGRPAACGVLTVSDTRRGARDLSGELIERLITRAGHRVVTRAWVKDEPAAIRRAARAALARRDVDVLVVTGGTGLARRDLTPEALSPLADRALPGFGELFRVLSLEQVGAAAWLSRAAAFVARGRLVVLLPGSRGAVQLALGKLLLPELGHALRMLGRRPGKE